MAKYKGKHCFETNPPADRRFQLEGSPIVTNARPNSALEIPPFPVPKPPLHDDNVDAMKYESHTEGKEK